ncbi:MAG: hypothetical protein HY904_05600 [Deltaproteobacteria bacterium]|nr:hypothetical protein [Deltaproteobacteria bacterium]
MRAMRWMMVAGVVAGAAGCFSAGEPRTGARAVQRALPAGEYAVQSAEYDDATGQYRVMVLGAPAGTRPVLESDDLRLARLSDEAVARGERAQLAVEADGAVLRLAPDFRVAYVHNVTQEQTDPGTGQRETVVVRQETGFWTPFAAAMAGNMVANALFAPHYVYPPMYAPGGMVGVGAWGASRAAALDSYRANHGTLPQPARLAAAGAPLKRPGDVARAAPGGAGSSKFKQGPVAKPRPVGRPFGIRRR